MEVRPRRKAGTHLRGRSGSHREASVAVALPSLDSCRSRSDRHMNCGGCDRRIAALAVATVNLRTVAVRRKSFSDHRARVVLAVRIAEVTHSVVGAAVRTCCVFGECEDQ